MVCDWIKGIETIFVTSGTVPAAQANILLLFQCSLIQSSKFMGNCLRLVPALRVSVNEYSRIWEVVIIFNDVCEVCLSHKDQNEISVGYNALIDGIAVDIPWILCLDSLALSDRGKDWHHLRCILRSPNY